MTLSKYGIDLLLDFDFEELEIKDLLLIGRELLYQSEALKKQSLAKDNLLAITNRVRVKDEMMKLISELKNRYLIAFDSFTVANKLKFSRLICDLTTQIISEQVELKDEVVLIYE